MASVAASLRGILYGEYSVKWLAIGTTLLIGAFLVVWLEHNANFHR